MRRFNAGVLMYRSAGLRLGLHLSTAGRRLQMQRQFFGRIGTWREPMRGKRRAGRRHVMPYPQEYV